ncbi:MAG TPA: hypothetical protein DDZ89_21380 [Clostridiales bacterium]|nr:hypothetical protein [Clostridiales bacterium]
MIKNNLWIEVLKMINVGVVSRSFPELTNQETAQLMHSNGFTVTELCFACKDSPYWVYNGRSDLSTLTDEKAGEVIQAYTDLGIHIPVIGVFTNLIETEDTELEKNIQYFERHMQIASNHHIPYVATECGFISGKRGLFADTFEQTFQRLLYSFKTLTQIAKKYQVTVVLEPSVIDIVPSAKRAHDFINQIAQDNLKILLDPANLIANSSEKDMFDYLKDHIAYIHGKDRFVNDARGRCVGDGQINWPEFLGYYHRYAEGKPFILEYVNRNNFCEIRDRVLKYDLLSGSSIQ